MSFSILNNIPAQQAARVLAQTLSSGAGPIGALSRGDHLAEPAQQVQPTAISLPDDPGGLIDGLA